LFPRISQEYSTGASEDSREAFNRVLGEKGFIKEKFKEYQYGDAQIFAKMYEDKIVCWDTSTNNGAWYVWSGSAWKQDNGSDIQKLIIRSLSKLYIEISNSLDTTREIHLVREISKRVQSIQSDTYSKGVLRLSKSLLFDISAEIPKRFLEVIAGGDLLVNLKIFNLGTEESVELPLEFSIRDDEGTQIFVETRNVTVKTQISFSEIFRIPEGIEIGDYLFYVKVFYNDQLASASVWFKVRPKTFFEEILPFLVIGFIIFTIIIIMISLSKRLRHELYILRKHKG